MTKLNEKTKGIAIFAMFTAIMLLLAFTPLGFIRIPLLLINATILHVPVIVGSIVLGVKAGAFFGFLFGVLSLINNTIAPGALSFAFSPFAVPVIPGVEGGSPFALIVCFVPRILVGIVPRLVYVGTGKLFGKNLTRAEYNVQNISRITLAGVAGSLTNTLLVMHLIYLFFMDSFAMVRGVSAEAVYGVILGVIATNGIPEALIAAAVTAAVCVPLQVIQNKTAARTTTM